MSQKQKFGLGRGLSSLIPRANYFSSTSFAQHPVEQIPGREEVLSIPIDKIVSNQFQPRQYFPDEELQELSRSIKQHGILQPLVVIAAPEQGRYELVAGERRWRAARLAGLRVVPAILRAAGELEQLQLALIENIQRSDLTPIEEALAYQKLNDDFGLTHDQIAQRMGKSRPAISNTLRLLALPAEMQAAIGEGKITFGHAKILLSVADKEEREKLFKRILGEKLTVSDATLDAKTKTSVRSFTRQLARDPNLAAYEDALRSRLGTKVNIRRRGKLGGQIVIEYYGDEELRAIVKKIT